MNEESMSAVSRYYYSDKVVIVMRRKMVNLMEVGDDEGWS
jgi:hypothetical protein